MAITGAVTLADVARVTQNKVERGIIMDLLRNSDLMKVVPFVTKNTLQIEGHRWDTLPSVAFRAINEGYTATTGGTTPYADGMAFLGGLIKIDNQLDNLDASNFIEHPRTTQTKMKLAAMAYAFSYYFIKGSQANNVKEFNGIDVRISNLPARQTVTANGGTALDVTASAANSLKFINALHDMNDLVGGADAWLMNRTLKLGIGRALRLSGLLSTTQDAFGRKFDTLLGGKIIDVGLKSDQSTEVILNDEGSSKTKLYAVRFGQDGLMAVQKNKLTARNKGEDPDTPTQIIEIDWGVTLTVNSRYCMAVCTDIKDPSSWT